MGTIRVTPELIKNSIELGRWVLSGPSKFFRTSAIGRGVSKVSFVWIQVSDNRLMLETGEATLRFPLSEVLLQKPKTDTFTVTLSKALGGTVLTIKKT